MLLFCNLHVDKLRIFLIFVKTTSIFRYLHLHWLFHVLQITKKRLRSIERVFIKVCNLPQQKFFRGILRCSEIPWNWCSAYLLYSPIIIYFVRSTKLILMCYLGYVLDWVIEFNVGILLLCFTTVFYNSACNFSPRDARSVTAKRGIAIVSRPSICPSVCNVHVRAYRLD